MCIYGAVESVWFIAKHDIESVFGTVLQRGGKLLGGDAFIGSDVFKTYLQSITKSPPSR